jgi:hypothetical protein
MQPNPPQNLTEIAKQLPDLLEKLGVAANKSSTVEQHREAFRMGCDLLTALVDCLDKKDSALKTLQAALGFSISVDDIEKFVTAESDVLRRMNLTEKDIKAANELLRSLGKNGELRDLQVNESQTLEMLKSLRDSLCYLASLTERNRKVSTETVDIVSDSVLDTCLITGDLLAVPVGMAAGPLGVTAAVFLAVASVGSGLKSIFKKIGKLRDRVRQEGEDEKQSESSDQIQKALRKKPAPKLEKK